ncbi:MAG: nucleotide exchange factor GrpE [Candidatus Aenigmarchaeota archaeon]|nr:nucleotide exchange factor GrpE [Candidatus Aenigmarchaeota archaeon]
MDEPKTEVEQPSEKNDEFTEMKKLAEERLSQIKYLQADFDNYRKHFEKERKAIIALANEELMFSMLPVLDAFDAAAKAGQGAEALHKKLLSVLEKHGLIAIDTQGRRFNPAHHEALVSEKGDEDGVILEEFQKGYMLNGKVLRTSKVKISMKGDING